MAVIYNDADAVLEHGFFQGYDGVVLLIVLIQVLFKSQIEVLWSTFISIIHDNYYSLCE